MNINGVARGYLSKNLTGEEFFKKVAEMIRRELEDWQGNYVVEQKKKTVYELKVINEETVYSVSLPDEELEMLQSKSPYSLDVVLWKELINRGLQIEKGHGNYIPYLLGEYKVVNGRLF
ncbi:hypothetical protein UACE39S_05017 [Ureibacillus acetophenoni]